MGLADEIGSLRAGACADVAGLELARGRFEFADTAGNRLIGKQKLVPRLVVRAGEVCVEP
jgi:predicted amidohydrolase